MADEMVTARVDEHGRAVRLYVCQGRDARGLDLFLAPGRRALGEPEQGDVPFDVYPGAEPPFWRLLPAGIVRALVDDAEARGLLAGRPEVRPVKPAPDAVANGPSDAAMTAALANIDTRERHGSSCPVGLNRAHGDPAVGLDRSVCLRDVVDFVRGIPEDADGEHCASADVIAREFGGGA